MATLDPIETDSDTDEGGDGRHDEVGGAPSADPSVVRRTQLADLGRSVPLGVLLPLESSVLLTIALKEFDASGLVKGLLVAAGGFGLLASPFVTAYARRIQRPAMTVAATLCVLGALGFAAASAGGLALFVFGSIVGVAAYNSIIPLVTATYDRNFPRASRGRRVGVGLAARVAIAAVAGTVIGGVLKRDIDRWWTVTLVAAVASLALAWMQGMMPSAPLPRVEGQRAWPHFHLLAEDRRLRLTLGAWMLMGFGNLMLLPMRVEYLAGDEYGVVADAAKITLLTVTIPSVMRLLFMPFFGAVFDRLSFFSSRIMVNALFTLYVAAFFSGTSDAGLIVGAVVLGVAQAGGDLMWTLWVTKFAPPGRVADYMGLHTFFTGVRAVSAPLVAFAIIQRFELIQVAWLAAGLMVASSLVLVPEARLERARRAAEATVPAPVSPDII